MNIEFEFTSPGTPQQNGKAERMIATLWGPLRAVNHHALGDSWLKYALFAEFLNTLTHLQNITVSESGVTCAYQKLYGYIPKWAENLKTLGEVAVVRNIQSNPSKIEPRGRIMIMIGYQLDGPPKCYKFFNPQSNKTVYSRDIRWLEKTYAEYKELQNNAFQEHKSSIPMKITCNESTTGTIDEENKSICYEDGVTHVYEPPHQNHDETTNSNFAENISETTSDMDKKFLEQEREKEN